MTDGLKDAHREAIIAVLAANERVERAVLFGSRATGTNTVSSDVDIALVRRPADADGSGPSRGRDGTIFQWRSRSTCFCTTRYVDRRRYMNIFRSDGVEWHLRPKAESQAGYSIRCFRRTGPSLVSHTRWQLG